MDALDVGIIRAMGIVPFGRWPHSADALKPSHIAGELGVTADRVLDRVERMEKEGILVGYDVQPNVRALGVLESTFHFTAPAGDKAALIGRLRALDGVFGVYDYLGDDTCVQVFYRDAADRDAKLARIAKEAGLAAPPRATFDRAYPEPGRVLTPLDLRILAAMKGKARASAAEVSAVVGVSARTVKRRLESMASAGLFDVYAWINLARVSGRVPIEFKVHADDASADVRRGVLRVVHDALLTWWTPPDPALGAYELYLFPLSAAHAEELRRAIAAVPGVTRVTTLVPTAAHYSGEWITERMATVAAAGRDDDEDDEGR